jgi:hypothetical protein
MEHGALLRVKLLAIWAAVATILVAVPLSHAGGNGNPNHCNAGRGNGAEWPAMGFSVDGLPNDCDPGNSAGHNHGGDLATTRGGGGGT